MGSGPWLPASGGTLTGDLRIKGSGNFGTKLNLGDGDYVHFYEPTDDCLEIKAKKINFVTSAATDDKFTLNGSPIGGGLSVEQQMVLLHRMERKVLVSTIIVRIVSY